MDGSPGLRKVSRDISLELPPRAQWVASVPDTCEGFCPALVLVSQAWLTGWFSVAQWMRKV